METKFGPAVCHKTVSGNKDSVALVYPTYTEMPDSVWRVPTNDVWLLGDRPERYDISGAIVSEQGTAQEEARGAPQANSSSVKEASNADMSRIEKPDSVHAFGEELSSVQANADPGFVPGEAMMVIGTPDPNKMMSRFTGKDIGDLSQCPVDVVNADLPRHYHLTLRHPLRPVIQAGEHRELQDMLALPAFGHPVRKKEGMKCIDLLWVYVAKPGPDANLSAR